MWEEPLATPILPCLTRHWLCSSEEGGVPLSHFFFFLLKVKIHLGSATDFREMVPKPGPSKPGAQKPLDALTNQCLLLIGYQASLSDLLFLLSSLSICPNVLIRETGPNCRPHPQVGRNGKQAKARGKGEGRQEFVCSVVLRLHTLIVCLE